MKKIAVIPCPSKDKDYSLAIKAVELLRDAGAKVFYPKQSLPCIEGALAVDEEQAYEQCDAVVGFGGDGSLISQALRCAKYGKAILGCNMGKVGYLAEVELGDLPQITKILDTNYSIEQRMVLSVEDNDGIFYALNDAVVSRGGQAKIAEIGLLIDGHDVGTFRSDGLILATPTGSTAYSLSAGGSVIDPSLECIAVTPVCPHQFGARPMIFSSNSILTIQNRCSDERIITVSLDGNASLELAYGKCVKVKKADMKCRFIRLQHRVFCDTLRKIKKY